MKKLFYLAKWFISARFFGKKKPLQTVLFISDKCNLRCKHCVVYNEKNPLSKTYGQIREDLQYSYNRGARFVDFEGGEPFLWHGTASDGREINVNDLCDLAREIGFFSTTITTNAQLPFPNSKADSIWVSMDGTGKYHDEVRGEGTFERLEKNIASSGHKHLSVNMVVNTQNYENVEDAIKFAKENPHIEKISINFHTPYEGTEHLYINDLELRSKIIDKVIEMKRKGYPIMNSVSGLKFMKKNTFKKQCWVSNFILTDGTRLDECAGKTAGLCDKCGFCMAGEMHAVYTFRPDTLLAGFSLRM
ncbi:MAG: radical SAM protein [Bacteroidales bacterium]|jgi:sulfatase maturation enzyme AslB (radical SAM superfamily)|nr:radical SAM protein [Bacteroidales bacterium]